MFTCNVMSIFLVPLQTFLFFTQVSVSLNIQVPCPRWSEAPGLHPQTGHEKSENFGLVSYHRLRLPGMSLTELFELILFQAKVLEQTNAKIQLWNTLDTHGWDLASFQTPSYMLVRFLIEYLRYNIYPVTYLISLFPYFPCNQLRQLQVL